jgi:purine nucleoside phosphorylase
VEVAVVLGSGLAAAADSLEAVRAVPYASLPGFPETTVAGHPGRLVSGELARPPGAGAVWARARVRGLPGVRGGLRVRVAATLGAHTLVVTNVAGGVDPAFEVGEIVAISITSTSPGSRRSPAPTTSGSGPASST